MSMRGSSIGTIVGALVGGIVGSIIPGVGTMLGISLGATETTPAVAPLPGRVPVPPGLGALLKPLWGLPFRYGQHDPARGSIDCLGLLAYLWREGLGMTDRPEAFPALPIVWRQRPAALPGSWVDILQPWDMVMWHDPGAGEVLKGVVPNRHQVYHLAMALNRQVLVSATLDRGVCLLDAQLIAQIHGPAVLGVVRPPPAVGNPWCPARGAIALERGEVPALALQAAEL